MILNKYVPANVTFSGVSATARIFFPVPAGPPATSVFRVRLRWSTAGPLTPPASSMAPSISSEWTSISRRDRIYGSFFRTPASHSRPNVIPQFSTTNNYWQRALQVDWTHDFSPTTLNEVIFAQNRIEGKNDETGDFSIPGISVTGQNVGYGVGFAQGDFIQHNYHWRDVLTHVHGAHVLKVGYEGLYGDDVEPFQGPWSHPAFTFNNLLSLAQDAPLTESGVMYSPITGQQTLWSWDAASKTWAFSPRTRGRPGAI